MKLPHSRGPVSTAIFDRLRNPLPTETPVDAAITSATDALDNDDLHIALWVLYEMHYRSFDDVDDRCEWDPALLQVRAQLEAAFEDALRAAVDDALRDQSPDVGAHATAGGGDFESRFFALVRDFDGPQLAKYVQRSATATQIRELLQRRSIYQLKEADPHAWLLPRLTGPAKSALVELQFDEYGCGAVGKTHAELFAVTMDETGLDSTYGAYIDTATGSTLAVSNVMSLFTLHRAHRGAAAGHLAAFEATSSLPCKRYAAGLRRAGFSAAAAHYFDEHVEADAVHEQLAVRTICSQMIAAEPHLEADVFFGALSCLVLEGRESTELLDRWDQEQAVRAR